MAMKITDDCISCGACEPECPVDAITEGPEMYEIDSEKCVECVGYYRSPACQDVCPSDAIMKNK